MTRSPRYPTLLRRHEQNPILTAADWPYPAHTVFNPGATRLADVAGPHYAPCGRLREMAKTGKCFYEN